MRHFVEQLPQQIISEIDLIPLERLCIAEMTRGNISRIYKILLAEERPEIPPFIIKCERELGVTYR